MILSKNKGRLRVLAILLLLAFSATSALAATSQFPDVKDNYWALQELQRASAKKVVVGYEDGSIKPDQAVTQFEAVIMAIRMMGLEGQAKSVAKGTALSVTVPTWDGAYEVAVVADKAGLIDAKDFTHDKAASREWVAKLLVKAMKSESQLSTAEGIWLGYNDINAIGKDYLNYVKVANKADILKGYPDGTFGPQKTVTRAEMVAFLNRVDRKNPVISDAVVMGKIESINGINIGLKTTKDEKKNVYVTNQSKLYDKNGKDIAVTDLKVGQSLYAITNGSILLYLEMVDETAKPVTPVLNETTITGTIELIVPDKSTIVIKGADNALNTVVLDSKTVIKNADGTKQMVFADLRMYDAVKASVGEKQLASSVTLTKAQTEGQLAGAIYSVDVYRNVIIMEQSEGLKTYKMDDKINVSVSGMLSATTSNLRIGDMATFKVVNGVMTDIAVGSSASSYEGNVTIVAVDTTHGIINFTNSAKELKASYYDTRTTFTYNGETGSATNLQSDDVAKVKVDNNRLITVAVENRKLSEGLRGTVLSVDVPNAYLGFQDAAGTTKLYPVNKNAAIYVSGRIASLSDVKKDMGVEITLVNNSISVLRANNATKGIVAGINANNNMIEVTPDNGSATQTYNVASNVSIYSCDTVSYALRNVAKGDRVELKLADNMVTQIYIQKTAKFTVTDTYSSSSQKITVKNTSGSYRTLYIYNDVELVVQGVGSPNVSNIRIGDEVTATYLGDTLTKVEVNANATGTVDTIDAAKKTFAVKDYSGNILSYSFTTGSTIVENGYASSDFGKLKVGDRIYVGTGDAGIKVDKLQSKTARVGTFYSDKSRLFLQNSSTVGDWTAYTLASNVYIHQGTINLGPSDFPLDTLVTVYYSGNTIYEVVKN